MRAVAVLSVIAFHVAPALLPGGLVGVDVFFVISGYLITRVIQADLAAGRFSIASFYERRVRRIFPALFVMLGFSAFVAALRFIPRDLEEFGGSLTASALFASNLFFWRGAGYFSGPADHRPLLHTWSLGVEEQFYILFPLFLLLVRRRTKTALAVVAAGSFAGSLWATLRHPDAAFYLAPFRAWELMTGALLATGAIRVPEGARAREAFAAFGVVLIAWALLSIDRFSLFPGVLALAPCVGTALLIWTAQDTRIGAVLSFRPVVFVGLISYSLYLWHWPVLVFGRYQSVEPLTVGELAAAIAAAFTLAVLSHRYVETPARRSWSRSRAWTFAAMGSVLAVTVGTASGAGEGWPRRFTGPQLAYAEQMDPARYAGAYGGGKCVDDQACESPPGEGLKVLLWGDSFASHLYPGLSGLLGSRGSVSQYSAAICPPRGRCRAFNGAALRALAEIGQRMDVVVLAARWSEIERRMGGQALDASLREALRIQGPRLILVGQTPTFAFQVPRLAIVRTEVRAPERVFTEADDHRDLNRRLSRIAEETGAVFYDPRAKGCNQHGCLTFVEGRPLHWDFGHLTQEGSRFYARPLVDSVLDEAAVRHP